MYLHSGGPTQGHPACVLPSRCIISSWIQAVLASRDCVVPTHHASAFLRSQIIRTGWERRSSLRPALPFFMITTACTCLY